MNLKEFLENMTMGLAKEVKTFYDGLPKNYKDLIKEEYFPNFYIQLKKNPQLPKCTFRLFYLNHQQTPENLIGYVGTMKDKEDQEVLALNETPVRIVILDISNRVQNNKIDYWTEIMRECVKAYEHKKITSHVGNPEHIDKLRREYKFQPYGRDEKNFSDTILLRQEAY
jgi:hypothetical protein